MKLALDLSLSALVARGQGGGIFDLIDIGGGAITDLDGAKLQDVRT